MVFSILNDIIRPLNYGIEQLRSNSWYIFLLILSIYVVRDQCKYLLSVCLWHGWLYVLVHSSSTSNTSYINLRTVKKIRSRASGVALGTSGNSTDRNSTFKARSKREEEMHQARLRQQEILNQKAKDALELQRELLKKKPSEPKPTNDSTNQTTSATTKYATKPSSTATTSKSKTTTTSSGFNPMQPWSASAGGGSYR